MLLHLSVSTHDNFPGGHQWAQNSLSAIFSSLLVCPCISSRLSHFPVNTQPLLMLTAVSLCISHIFLSI